MAEFLQLSELSHVEPIAGEPIRFPGAANIGAKKSLAAFLRAGQTAKSLEEHPKVYTRKQSCIDKLVLACFCLGVPRRETMAAVALVLSDRNAPANIAAVAAILNHKLAAAPRRLTRNRSKLAGMRGGINPTIASILKKFGGTDIERTPARSDRAFFPATILELEKGLDDLLTFLRARHAAGWNQMKSAGVVKDRSLRSRKSVKEIDKSTS